MKPYDLELKRKTGFRNKMPNIPVIIFDERGIPFYDTSKVDSFVYEFNLPPGNYIVGHGRIEEMLEPVDYSHLMLPLPKPVRRRANPERFKIVVTNNPFKCTVDWKNKEIIYDRALVDEPLPKIRRIFEHEIGHRYYGTQKPDQTLKNYYEACCDRYSHNRMLEDGFNPSQIELSMVDSLTPKNKWRENLLVEDMEIAREHFDHYDGEDADYNYYVPPELSGKVYRSKVARLGQSRGPNDFLPLINTEKSVAPNTLMGSIVDSQQDSKGFTWVKFNIISYWFPIDNDMQNIYYETGTVTPGQQPSQQTKDEIIKDISPGGQVLHTAGGVAEGVSKIFSLTEFLGKNLPLILIIMVILVLKYKT